MQHKPLTYTETTKGELGVLRPELGIFVGLFAYSCPLTVGELRRLCQDREKLIAHLRTLVAQDGYESGAGLLAEVTRPYQDSEHPARPWTEREVRMVHGDISRSPVG